VLLQSLSGVTNFVANITIIAESVREMLALHMVPDITLGAMVELATDITTITQISSPNKLVQILWFFRSKITT